MNAQFNATYREPKFSTSEDEAYEVKLKELLSK